MKQQLLHTPEGVRDIYNSQCENKLYLEQQFRTVFKKFGYQPIQTPTFEFFDMFAQELGTTSSKDLYKFFDREGNTLVLRPDITPSVARCAAKYFGEEKTAIRLSYMGNTFVNNSSYQGRLKEVTQAGAELLGDCSVDSDAEMIAMCIQALQSVGLKEFQISVGHAGFFKSLAKISELEDEVVTQLLGLLQNRNYWGVQELVEPLTMEAPLKELFLCLGNFYNNDTELAELLAKTAGYTEISETVQRLIDLYETLKLYGVEEYISFEPGMPEGTGYYTGVIFHGYSYGLGEPIVKGGRYDNLTSYFGKDSSAIGFALTVDQILLALQRQKIKIPQTSKITLVIYEPEKKDAAIQKACELRGAGKQVELLRKKQGIDAAYYEARANQEIYEEIIKIGGEQV
jgi:ATP phosphoribosyltransferase regulatory subunit